MTRNMGTADRGIRFLIALAIVALYITGAIGGTLAVALGIIAILGLVTSLSGWCPAYEPFHISTRRPTCGTPSGARPQGG